MHFLNLVEAITKSLTADNVSTMVTLVEKLIDVAESISSSSTDQNSSNKAG